jgi:glycosyltransferase involved in cell wall biosynthesis
MRMPTPGNSTQVARKILRKLRSLAKLVRRPLPDLPNFHVMSPVPLPFYGNPAQRRVNAVLVRLQVTVVARALGLREPVIIATLPTAGDVVRPMRRRSLVFNRSDRHSDFTESDGRLIREMELALLAESDHVLYVSRALLAEERPHTGVRGFFLDHGVDLDHFRPVGPDRLPADLSAIPGPRIGFFGALDELVVDFDLLERLAKELPDASLVLIGDSSHPMDRFDAYPNVHWLGFRPYSEIPAYGSGFDLAIMPWVRSSWIESCNPIKLKEYLALGLPVVSTEFAEVRHYREHVQVAADAGEFVDLVRATLADPGPAVPEQRRRVVVGHSWRSRADLVQKLVSDG